MSLIVKIMHGADNAPGIDGPHGPHSVYGDVVSCHFPARGEAQIARLWVREPVKTALVPGFVENERLIDLTGPTYVMNEAGRTISSFCPEKVGGDAPERVYQTYSGYEELTIKG